MGVISVGPWRLNNLSLGEIHFKPGRGQTDSSQATTEGLAPPPMANFSLLIAENRINEKKERKKTDQTTWSETKARKRLLTNK